MSTPRDYGGTGATSQGGKKYISIGGLKTDTAYLKFQDNRVAPDGKPYTAFSGYFDGLEVTHRAASIEDDLPERDEAKIALTVMEGGNEQTYLIGISSHWKNPAFGQAINSLAGLSDRMPNMREAKIAVSVYMKTKPGKRPSLNISIRREGQFLPQRFPFDEATSTSPGVPPLDQQGDFWVGIAKELAAKYPVAVASGSVSEPDPSNEAPKSADVTPPTTASAPPPPPPAAPAQDMRKIFGEFLSKDLIAITEKYPALVATALKLIFAKVAQKKDGKAFYERGEWTLNEVLSELRNRYIQITGDQDCTITADGLVHPSVKSDDLPF